MVKKIFILIIAGLMIFTVIFLMKDGSDQSEAALTVTDNTKTQADPEVIKSEPVVSGISVDFVKTAENDTLELYLNPDSLAIQVKDKKSGFIYSSIQENIEGLNEVWTNFVYSGITVEYMNKDNKIIRLPLTQAKANMKVDYLENGFQVDITYKEGFSLRLSVTLEKDYITVLIPDDSIVETGNENVLENIYLYPFLGATKGTAVPGYLFVPDGSGALIRTDQESIIATSPYIKRIYGNDMGIGAFAALSERNILNEAEQIYMPVYGAVYSTGQYGIAAIIEEGDAYADIEAYVSGISTPYNFITSRFILRETYKQLLDEKGTTMIANQKKRNHTDIQTRYTFLTGEAANYVGIAKTYQSYLIEQGVLKKENKAAGNIPLKIEFLGAELKSQLIGHSTVVMTTVKEMDSVLTDLLSKDITNVKVNIRGFNKQGASAGAPTEINFQSKVGTRQEWEKFIQKYRKLGLEIGFYTDFNRGYEDGGSYNSKKDSAQAINEIVLETYDNGHFTYLSPDFAAEHFNKEAAALGKLGLSTAAVDTMGYELYSNWNKKSVVSRSDALLLYQSLKPADVNLALYSPNSFLWGNADAIYDIPVTSSQYLIFTDTVPFMQLVLKGYLPYYAQASNFHADSKLDLLKIIEYGAYPSYFVTDRNSINLFDTASEWLYTSSYDIWNDQIAAEYKLINSVLSQVEGSIIVNRTVPNNGIVLIQYSNGITILINYNKTDYTYNNQTVEGESIAVLNAE